MHDNPFQSPASVKQTQNAGSRKIAVWLPIVLLLSLFGAVIVWVLPPWNSVRTPGFRAICSNNLRHIQYALEDYAKDYGRYPPAYTVDANGKPLHSWRTLILPYLGAKTLYQSIDLTKSWDDPVNAKALQSIPEIYHCPRLGSDMTTTTYVAVVTPKSCLRPGQSASKKEITDDPAKTIVLLEVAHNHAVPWMSPQDVDETFFVEEPSKSGQDDHWPHQLVVFANGSVYQLEPETTPAERRAMITIAGGD